MWWTGAVNDDDLALAFELAADAAAISLSWSGGDVPVTTKEDGSPVSEGDLEVDRALGEILAEERPEDGLLSEEQPERPGTSGRRWIIDPIDGTRQFVAGEAGWGNHIALEVDGEVLLGIITRPEDDELFWAVRGQGAFRCSMDSPHDRSQPITLSTATDPASATLSGYGITPADLEARPARWEDRTAQLFTDFFAGRLDGLLMRGGKVWDFAPLVPLVRESGGEVRSPDGTDRIDQGSLLVAGHGLLPGLAAALFRVANR